MKNQNFVSRHVAVLLVSGAFLGMGHASAIQPVVLDPITGVTASAPDNSTADQLVGAAGGNYDLHTGGSGVNGASDSEADGNSYPGNTYYPVGETITFSLGADYSVSDLLVWNDTQNDYQNLGTQSAEILYSTTGAPGSYTDLGSFTFDEVPYGSTNNSYGSVLPQDVAVSIPGAKYIELELLSNYGSANPGAPTDGNTTTASLNVVEFVGDAVPEPSTYAMLALGLVALVAWQRKRAALAI
jgi:hypothetical protein